ncbi:acyl-CoA dehydrogenase family protein [Kitasatospora cineracea]|uniref:Two-component flavin-dependent monooxygenase n=1 Tax=Kitasatospora cineracea TaxID=88074 RepID=A0A8G1UD89_9ACTN|nr:acyl-CoA dehydrogenase family protein [Kitasatospora cineracea]ROR34009.1 two-component flavin-dependent monooxygenase [Kitasatospora cineracea]
MPRALLDDTAATAAFDGAATLGDTATLGDAAARAATIAARDADRADQERRLAGHTFDALVAAGFARHFVPRRWGGTEGGFADLVHRAAALAEDGCPSAAWCAALLAAHGRFAAFLPARGQQELWGATPDVRIAAAISPPAGTAEPLPAGGWRLSGQWRYASGVDFADWVLLAAWEPSGSGPRARVLALPAGDFATRQTWDADGLRGTGSNSVLADSVLVPPHRSFLLADMLAGRRDAAARCHAAPAQLAGGLLLAAPALGAARRALRLWSQWAGAAPHREAGAVHLTLARSSAEADAARLLLADAARRADTDPVTEHLVARNRRDAVATVDLLVTAVGRLVRTGGPDTGPEAGELQRLWRDVRTVASHGALRPQPAADAYAAAVLGPEAG